MKSLFIINDFPPILGGQSNYYFNLCGAFPKGELTILAPRCQGYQSFDQNHYLPIIRRNYLIQIPVVEKICKILLPFFYSLPIIKREKITCIHCGHVLSTGVIGLVFKKFLKIPYIVYTHSADILEYQKYGLIKKLLQSILKHAARVSCNSQFTFDKLLDLGVAKDKIKLIYPKTDLQRFDPSSVETASIVSRYHLAAKKVILSINRLIERKGNDVMIKAMPDILKEIPNAIYVIGGSGYYEGKLKEIVKELDLEKAVIFVNNLSDEDVIKFYKVCEVFVMISRTIKEEDTEGFGVVFLEANACGKPVIGGRSGGIPEAVVDGYSGLLVDPLNVNEITRAVVRLCQEEQYAVLLGQQGKKRVQEQFDSKLYSNDVKNLMDGIYE
jgi:phosphatidylinositol alpha-1,6-mannosyltransferase